MKCSSAMVAARLAIGGLRLDQVEPPLRPAPRAASGRSRHRPRALLKAACSRLWITSWVVKALISSASFGGAPSRNCAHALDEEGLALGKGRRQRIVEGGRDTDRRHATSAPAVASRAKRRSRGVMREVGGGHACGGHRLHSKHPSSEPDNGITDINVNKLANS